MTKKRIGIFSVKNNLINFEKSEWGEDTQVPVFKSLRKSFRKIFKSDKTNNQSEKTETNDQQVANEPEISTDDVVAPKPDDKKKKSKLCTIL